jgi:hypothetical protein
MGPDSLATRGSAEMVPILRLTTLIDPGIPDATLLSS